MRYCCVALCTSFAYVCSSCVVQLDLIEMNPTSVNASGKKTLFEFQVLLNFRFLIFLDNGILRVPPRKPFKLGIRSFRCLFSCVHVPSKRVVCRSICRFSSFPVQLYFRRRNELPLRRRDYSTVKNAFWITGNQSLGSTVVGLPANHVSFELGMSLGFFSLALKKEWKAKYS